jgi:hypothetical protein
MDHGGVAALGSTEGHANATSSAADACERKTRRRAMAVLAFMAWLLGAMGETAG